MIIELTKSDKMAYSENGLCNRNNSICDFPDKSEYLSERGCVKSTQEG